MEEDDPFRIPVENLLARRTHNLDRVGPIRVRMWANPTQRTSVATPPHIDQRLSAVGAAHLWHGQVVLSEVSG